MGNRLCKNKRLDTVDGGGVYKSKNQSKFDRIFSRFHLKPSTWKSESNLSNESKQKQVISRNDNLKPQEEILKSQNLSKSTDWTDATLEVPEEKIHLKNPQLALIFDNSEKSTPTPPPRKHQKKNFREKIDFVKKNKFNVLQNNSSKNSNKNDINKNYGNKPPIEIEEPMFVKKKINYKCPICDSDEVNHNRDHHHNHENATKNNKNTKKEATLDDITSLIIPNNDPRLQDPTKTKKSNKKNDNKSGSVTSLPNYNDLKLSVAKSDSSEEKNSSKSGSRLSLQSNQSKKLSSTKLDVYMDKVRSFGSLIPQKLNKSNKVKPEKEKETKIDHSHESDDSFGPLEDWDLGLIEHYNPKEASLPRPKKKPQKLSKEAMLGIEGLVVKEEEIVPSQNLRNSAPVPKREVSPPHKFRESTPRDFSPPKILRNHDSMPQKEVAVFKNLPEVKKIQNTLGEVPKAVPDSVARSTLVPEDVCLTPPPSPKGLTLKNHSKFEEIPLNSEEIGHSNLLRIIKELSPKPEPNKPAQNDAESNMSSLTPSLVEFEKNLNAFAVEDFIKAEKDHTNNSVDQ